ncbi:flagellar protein FlaG [Aromatoleum toluclasticum]|uniref:flagellar protein FlaG n=1 Tax=Aromatoleum toluclasticum TaxID=92003 RepID=UPI000360150B|nr:flagellar protein FlaG [Aromatoleum toluclasticum]MCC4115897.1 flagellar protein FlaG [Aromatoleum toluclasticum]
MTIQNITSNAAAMTASAARAVTGERGAIPSPAAPQATQATSPPGATAPTHEALLQAVAEVQKVIAPVAQNLRFSIDEDTGRTLVKLVDSTTDEVIRQIPSEEVLAISKALDRLQGLLIQQKA